ncbi:MAG: ACT domain-containing protein [Desemzia incerta]|uniref:ACT domain-containing protein n=1 Tax=Desemzia TaxID=82800 RepID=UPI0016607A1B|nr:MULTISPECIES: ACT domain-containing protein [Desemzia]MCI3028040.1 ACT domain-containing protein [Desemzia sp. C1]
MKAIVTVIGKDRVGIVAGVSKKLSDLNININDISQTIMEGYFTMMVLCDLANSELEFSQVKEELAAVGEELEIKVRIQRQEIFDAMHTL